MSLSFKWKRKAFHQIRTSKAQGPEGTRLQTHERSAITRHPTGKAAW